MPQSRIKILSICTKESKFYSYLLLVNNDIIRSYKKYNVVPSAILLLSTTRASRQHHHGMETRPALQHSCRNQRYNYYEKSKGQYITADIRNMADEEEQPSVEEVAQQQPEEKVALEVKVGKFQFADGSWYEGEYVVDGATSKRQGNGFLQDGEESYEGNWENDTMNGEGVYSFSSGASYSGSFKDGEFEGKGEYKWVDGAVYSGDWHQNKMHGTGIFIDPEEVRWEGKFHNGKYYNGRCYVTLR